LLIVDRDNTPRTAGLREETVEPIERADVEHTAARKPIRVEHHKPVAVVARDPRRVDPGRERERVKPQRNRIADALGVHNRRADRQHVSDNPFRSGRLWDRLDRLDRDCKARQPIPPISRSHDSHNSITGWRQRLATSPRARRRESATG
jgi:hypothetical protein